MSKKKLYDSLAHISAVNLERALRWHNGSLESWSAADWGNAMAGEAGEVCNEIKKFRRIETGLVIDESGLKRQNHIRSIAMEVGDTFLYLNLICAYFKFDMAEAIKATFNRVSEREQFPERL